jgi:GTPase SAR1 family protein
LAKENDMQYVEVSAKQGSNVEEAFNKAIETIYEKIETGVIDAKNEV